MESDQQSEGRHVESAGGRLDSWKEIAAYLRRDVRTVQRWHDRAGLPVRRHVDAKQRGVFAFQNELDAWANQFRPGIEGTDHQTDSKEPGSRRLLKPSWLVIAGGLLCAAIVLAAWMIRYPVVRSVPFHQRGWVLVASFENRTGDEILDESLQYVLERELAASSFINVVPRLRVQDDLRLMRRPGDSGVITRTLAREVALRDGNIQLVVAGRADRIGAGYLLGVEIIDPQSGATLKSRTDQVNEQSELLGGLRRLAAWARAILGETDTVSARDARLPQVTTASLSALQLYAKAEEALSWNHRQAARVLLESAVREDPEFAMAHSRLATVLLNEPDVQAVAPALKHHAEQALALSSRTTEKERLRIVATYHTERVQPEKGVAAWEALATIDPDDWAAHSELAQQYYRLRRIPEAVREMERAAVLRPNDFTTAVLAAQAWALWAGQPEGARPYLDRARALWPVQNDAFSSEFGRANLPPSHARNVAWILFFPAYDLWRAGDIKGMLAEVQRVVDSDPLPTPADRDALLTIAIAFQMTAGRLKDARALNDRVFQERIRDSHLAVLADAVDDIPTLRRFMARVPLEGLSGRPLRLVRAGLYEQAELLISQESSNVEGYRETARGELALRRGYISKAVQDLQRGIELASAHTLSERYFGAESLASALEHLNRKEEAVKVLEAAAAAEPRFTRTGTSGAFWLRVLGRLSRTYRDLGRATEADAVDARLRQLLVLADSDHPLVAQLARSRR